jgi:hypothetical protein
VETGNWKLEAGNWKLETGNLWGRIDDFLSRRDLAIVAPDKIRGFMPPPDIQP